MNQDDWKRTLFYCLIIAVASCLPIFSGLGNWGIWDWDQHLFYHEVPRLTLLEYGQMPLWNPYACGGTVMLANPQSRFLSPFFVLHLVFGTVVGMKMEILLHLVLGLFGMYLVARKLGLSPLVSWLPATVFMLSSAFAINLTVGHTWYLTTAYLPWAFLFAARGLSRTPDILGFAVTIALMFLEGGVYPVAISSLFLGLFVLLLAILDRRWRPCMGLVLGFIAAGAFSALKLFPTLSYMLVHPRRMNDYSGFSLHGLMTSLLHSDQTVETIAIDAIETRGFLSGFSYMNDENSAYVGVVALTCCLFGLATMNRTRPQLVVGACLLAFLWLCFGDRATPSLWDLLQQVPVFSSMRVAQRFKIVLLFCIALSAGFGLRVLLGYAQGALANARVTQGLVAIVLLLVGLDLIRVDHRIWRDAFPIPAPSVTRIESFSQTLVTRHYYDALGWAPEDGYRTSGSSLYPHLLANRGVVNCYESMEVHKRAKPEQSPDYAGEVFLARGKGAVQIAQWSPNRVRVDGHCSEEEVVVLNQNYDAGWRTSNGEPVLNYEGLVAARVSKGAAFDFTFYYRPTSFTIGLMLTSSSALAAILYLFLVARRRHSQDGVPPLPP